LPPCSGEPADAVGAGLAALPFVVGSGLIGFLLLGRLFLRGALILALVLALLFAMRSRS